MAKKQGSRSAVLQYNWDAALIVGKISGDKLKRLELSTDVYTCFVVALLPTWIDCECGSFPFEKVLALDGTVELNLQMFERTDYNKMLEISDKENSVNAARSSIPR